MNFNKMNIISCKAEFTEEGTQVTVTIFVVVFSIVPMMNRLCPSQVS